MNQRTAIIELPWSIFVSHCIADCC